MKSDQITAGTLPPDKVVLVALSLPSQTPVTMAEVKPMNRASLASWVVPVLPPKSQPPTLARLPVPTSTAVRSISSICASTSGAMTRPGPASEAS